MSHLLENFLLFGRVLRGAGIDVHPDRLLDLINALQHVDLGARDEVYHTCRTLLVHAHDEIAIFDRAFAAFWRMHTQDERPADDRRTAQPIEQLPASHEFTGTSDADDAEHETPVEIGLKIWSELGILVDKDFAALTPDEIADARAALARLVWHPGNRRTRRWIRGHGPRLDIRRAIADSVRTGGDVVRLRRRARRLHPRPLVLLCDVSGSMERYSRMLLHFAHAVALRHRQVEAFVFSTELTRVTRQLRVRKPDDAFAALSSLPAGWSAGTRIGRAIKELHQRWSRQVLNRGPVVLLISDGWDRGDPGELGEQIARLQRSCHRLVWLNPLIGTADYAPLTRGLQAALPFVDDFLPARTLRNFADLATHLNALT
jgi:uncharacterized protein with von Willebrand factor type A (vWA) domain